MAIQDLVGDILLTTSNQTLIGLDLEWVNQNSFLYLYYASSQRR